jgi:DNA polymerase
LRKEVLEEKKMPIDFNSMSACTICPIRSGCKQVVVGFGNTNSKLVFVGEAPGADEDIIGRPFVGRGGQLLSKLLKEAGIDRKDVYITNAVKCRPPNNRTPTANELSQCKRWLWYELKTIQPKAVVTLGRTPTFLLLTLKPNDSMSKHVGYPHTVNYMAAKIYPWYHPSFLLRKGGNFDKKTVALFEEIKNGILLER